MNALLASMLIAVSAMTVQDADASESVNNAEAIIAKASERSTAVNVLLNRYRTNIEKSADSSRFSQAIAIRLQTLSNSDFDRLRNAASFDDFMYLFKGMSARTEAATVKAKATQFLEAPLVFYPVKPCTLVDSRFDYAGNRVSAKLQPRLLPYIYDISSAEFQGAKSTPCQLNDVNFFDIGALALTVTAVDAAGDGWFTLSPHGEPSGASVLNFLQRDAIANSTVVKSTGTFQVTTSRSVDILVNLIGVYVKSTPRLQCYNPGVVERTLNPGAIEYVFPTACSTSTGFVPVSTSCEGPNISSFSSGPMDGSPAAYCLYDNRDGLTSQRSRTSQTCCRVNSIN